MRQITVGTFALCGATSNKKEHVDHVITFLFNQGLTQAEMALHLVVGDNIHISVLFSLLSLSLSSPAYTKDSR